MATQIKTRILLPTKTESDWQSSDRVLSAGEIALVMDSADQTKFNLVAGKDSTYQSGVKHLVATADVTHYEASSLEQLSNYNSYKNGDTAVVKTDIAGTAKSYTAYVWDASVAGSNKWAAMDGNYSAENVYFKNDISCAGDYTQVGNISKSKTEMYTLPASGKSLKTVMETIFTRKMQPGDPTQPYVNLTASNMKAYEVGTKDITPSWTASLNAGSYTYGPATGVVASAWTVVNNTTSETSSVSAGSFTQLSVNDTTNYTLTVTANHNEGAIAKDNLGGDSNPVKKIAAGSKSKDSGTVTGFRNTFYGITTSKGDITSSVIRGLANKTTSKLSNTTLAVGGALRVIVAIPKAKPTGATGTYNTYAGATLSKVLDVNDSNSNLNGQFTKTEVNVEGYDGYTAIPYSVYYLDFASAHATDNFIITQS